MALITIKNVKENMWKLRNDTYHILEYVFGNFCHIYIYLFHKY